MWGKLFMFDQRYDFHCLRAQNDHNTSAGMLTWLLITAYDWVIALPGVGIPGGQTSLAGLVFCFGANTLSLLKLSQFHALTFESVFMKM